MKRLLTILAKPFLDLDQFLWEREQERASKHALHTIRVYKS